MTSRPLREKLRHGPGRGMPDPARLALFTATAIVLVVTPGPTSVYIMTRGISQGRRAAVVSALGVETADLVHITAAALGLSALIASSALAFTTVRYVGAAYLLYLGVRVLADKGAPVHPEGVTGRAARTMAQVYRQGFVVNLLNPKVALFFLAFLPQFVDPSRGSAAQQILVLGALFVIIGLAVDMLYAAGSGAIGHRLRRRPRALQRQRYFAGTVYIGLGVSAAAAGGDAST